MKVKDLIVGILNSGMGSQHSSDNLRRIRLINVTALIGVVFTPLLFLYNWRIGNSQEFLPLISFLTFTLIAFLVNKRRNQAAALILTLVSIGTSWWVTVISTTQVGAPYFNILFGLLAIYLVQNKWLRNSLALLAFMSFALLNAYQLMYRPFALAEYAPISLLLITIFIGVTVYDNNYQRNERKIQEQADNLMKLEKSKHEQEMAYKQRDIESVLTNNMMQLKLRKNIIEELEKIKRRKDINRELSKTLSMLKSEARALEKVHSLSDNVKEADAVLYQRLSQIHPNLTKSELEICAFVKIGMSSKEIGHIRNTTDNTINVLKTRIRKKFELNSNTQLREYLTSL